jgi:POT family proton-dependent oligopeptide transporter
VGLWSLLRKKGKEPSTPAKLMWGMTLTAAAYAIMMFAVRLVEIQARSLHRGLSLHTL